MTIPTLLPAYGRDYKNKQSIVDDINNNKDFMFSGLGCYINKEQLIEERFSEIVIRYSNFRKVTSLKLTKSGDYK